MRLLVIVVALALVPAAVARAEVFPPGEYEGATAQGRAVKFAADAGGVHLFHTRVTLACSDGTSRTIRFSMPHIHRDLEASAGQFSHTRRRGARDVLRVQGTLAGTSATGTLSRRVGSCRSGSQTWTAEHSGAESEHDHDHDGMHVGSATPYPDLQLASAAGVERADALRVATNAAAARFATVARAKAAGYVADPAISPVHRPGIVHYRKHGTRFWGRILEPRRPQALLFWCPSTGACMLVGFMYRAPPDLRPPTYGGLLGWHRHSERGTWMTHIWLTGDVASSLAQCVPFNGLHARNPLVAYESYVADVPHVDESCPDTLG